MQRLMFAASILFCLFVLVPCMAAPVSAADEPPMVVMLEVEGNNLLSADQVLSAVRNTRIGADLDQEAVAADLDALRAAGWFQEVLPPLYRKVLGGVSVVFRVVENPPLKEILIRGLTRVSPAKVRACFTLKPGDVVNPAIIGRDLIRLQENAPADFGVLLTLAGQEFDPDGTVVLDLVEMRLHRLDFAGLKKTRFEVVRREFSAREGEIFDFRGFLADLRRVRMRGLFLPGEDVKTSAVPGDPYAIDITVHFTEADSRVVGGSFTYQAGEMTGGIMLGDNNLFGTGNSVHVKYEANAEKRLLELDLDVPWLDARHTSLSLLLYDRGDSLVPARAGDAVVAARETSRGFTLGLGRPLGRDLTLSVSASHQILERSAMGNWAGTGTNPANPPPVTGGPVETNSLALRLDYSRLTPQTGVDKMYVAGGIRAQGKAEYAGGLLGGDADYARFQAETALFGSLGEGVVLALRLKGGSVSASEEGDPLHTAYFVAGGADTLRGYEERSFSGTGLALANLELRTRFAPAFEGVVFFDLGGVYGHETGWTPGQSYGLGMRIWVPYLNVQLRLDYGWRPGETEGVFHLALGETF